MWQIFPGSFHLSYVSKRPIYGNHPRASGLLAKFIGFIGTLKVERLTPSTAFKKTHSKHGPEPAARFERIVLLKK